MKWAIGIVLILAVAGVAYYFISKNKGMDEVKNDDETTSGSGGSGFNPAQSTQNPVTVKTPDNISNE